MEPYSSTWEGVACNTYEESDEEISESGSFLFTVYLFVGRFRVEISSGWLLMLEITGHKKYDEMNKILLSIFYGLVGVGTNLILLLIYGEPS